MRKFLFLMAAVLMLVLTACKTSEPRFMTLVNTIDYYKIGKNGKILLTESNSYSGEYQSLGSIVVTQTSGKVQGQIDAPTTKVRVMDGDEIYGDQTEYKSKPMFKVGDYKYATFSSALEKAVNAAEKMGGDAIINLQFRRMDLESVVVTGMVIKRK